MSKIIWHSLPPQKILDILKTNEKGLKEEEVKKRQERYGPNKLPEKKPLSHLQILLSQFKSPLIYILLIAAMISFLLKENTDALIILAAVLINTLIGFFQENNKLWRDKISYEKCNYYRRYYFNHHKTSYILTLLILYDKMLSL